MLFADLGLAERLEVRDARGNAECIEAYDRLYPDVDARAFPIAGGYAMYAGTDSPLTQAIGLGISAPVAAADFDPLEKFYRDRDSPAHVEMCPLADPSLLALFAERGYRVEEYSNVLARKLGSVVPEIAGQSEAEVRVPLPDEAHIWARTVVEGVTEDEADRSSFLDLFLSFFHMPSTTCFLASIDGQAAGGGVVSIDQGVAALFGAGTRPALRNRGVQTLLGARLALAAEAGCDIAMVTALPGSTSQRNAQRLGFRVIYTRSKMLRE